MQTKAFQIKTGETLTPVLAIQLSPDTEKSRAILSSEGLGLDADTFTYQVMIVGMKLLMGVVSPLKSDLDPDDRLGKAFNYIQSHFVHLESGIVIDPDNLPAYAPEPVIVERPKPKTLTEALVAKLRSWADKHIPPDPRIQCHVCKDTHVRCDVCKAKQAQHYIDNSNFI